MLSTRLLLLALGTFTLGCVSSSSYDRLERQYQLAAQDSGNQRHHRDLIAADLKAARAEIAALEEQVSTLRSASEDQQKAARSDHDSASKTAADLQAATAQLQATTTQLQSAQAMLDLVRDRLGSGGLNSKAGRDSMLRELESATTPAVIGTALGH